MKQNFINMNIQEILEYLPHRYPFLLVDKVLEIDYDNKTLLAKKNVTYNEPFFPGHFPKLSVMPGVLILEALAQAAGILEFKCATEKQKESILLFAGIDKARFKKTVIPGDTLFLEIKRQRMKGKIFFHHATAFVDDKVACSADLMCAIKEL